MFCLCAGLIGLIAPEARAGTMSLSFAGTLASPTATYSLVLAVGGIGSQSVVVQTWGFGGGKNAAGAMIAPGGFDELVALYSGTGPGALLVNGTADNQSNYGSYVGCPPAGTVAFSNGDAVCGDVRLTATVAPGTYTLVLSDANYVPNAFSEVNGTLGDGYADLTGGVFQTCDTSGSFVTACITPDANWAFDVTDTSGANLPTPEPGTVGLLASGLLGLAVIRRRLVG